MPCNKKISMDYVWPQYKCALEYYHNLNGLPASDLLLWCIRPWNPRHEGIVNELGSISHKQPLHSLRCIHLSASLCLGRRNRSSSLALNQVLALLQQELDWSQKDLETLLVKAFQLYYPSTPNCRETKVPETLKETTIIFGNSNCWYNKTTSRKPSIHAYMFQENIKQTTTWVVYVTTFVCPMWYVVVMKCWFMFLLYIKQTKRIASSDLGGTPIWYDIYPRPCLAIYYSWSQNECSKRSQNEQKDAGTG